MDFAGMIRATGQVPHDHKHLFAAGYIGVSTSMIKTRKLTPGTVQRLQMNSLIPAGLMALLGIGFFFHTSHSADVLGKYSWRYAAALAGYFLVVVPLTYFLARFLFATHEITLKSGRRIAVGPARKFVFLIFLVMITFIVAGQLLKRQLAESTITHARDVFHPYLQNTPRPNNPQLQINRWGFRGGDISQTKPRDAFRVFVFGGSTVFCGRIPFEQSHCRLLEQSLQAEYPGRTIQVQNVGGEWHCSQHSVMKLLMRVQEFSPDLAIISHGINDLIRSFEADDFSEGSYQSDYGHYYGPIVNLRRPTATTMVLARSVAGHWCSDFRYQQVRLRGPDDKGLGGMVTTFFPRAKPIEWNDWKSLPAFRRNMKDFVEIARSKHIDVILATQPYMYRDDLSQAEKEVVIFPISHQFDGKMASIGSMKRGMELFNATTRRIADEYDTGFVDLDAVVAKNVDHFYDEVHYTARGNQIIGTTLADFIVQSGIAASP